MVEFSFVAVLLVLLVLGIINFGLLLSFKQDVTRSATEGARVGAVETPPTSSPAAYDSDPRWIATRDATFDAVDSFGETCNVGGMECIVIVHNCTDPAPTPAASPATYFDDGVQDCVTVDLNYNNGAFPLLPEPPILGSMLPDSISASSTARLNQ